MTSVEMLEECWKASGKTKTFLSAKLNVSRPRLDYIFAHPDTATWNQAEILSKEFDMNKDVKKFIFLVEK